MFCNIKQLFYIVILLGLIAKIERVQARELPFFRASRALAMGDAFTAYGEGFEAVYYNPAGVARKNRAQFKYADLEMYGSQSLKQVFSDYGKNLGNLSATMATLQDHPGKPYSLGASFLPQFLVKNFSIGALARYYTEGIVDTDTENMTVYSFTDLALYSHIGAALMGGIIKIGVGVKVIDRAELSRTLTPAQYSELLTYGSQWQEGFAYGFDAGILLTSPTTFNPAIGISALDIGNTTFDERDIMFSGAAAADGKPSTMHQKLNVGFSIQPKHAVGVRSVIAFETKDVLNISANNYRSHLHAGWELNFDNSFKLRAGYNEGYYWTAGLGIELSGVTIEFSSYGENVSGDPSNRINDRKWVARYVLRF